MQKNTFSIYVYAPSTYVGKDPPACAARKAAGRMGVRFRHGPCGQSSLSHHRLTSFLRSQWRFPDPRVWYPWSVEEGLCSFRTVVRQGAEGSRTPSTETQASPLGSFRNVIVVAPRWGSFSAPSVGAVSAFIEDCPS
jgi:hypothetical protein